MNVAVAPTRFRRHAEASWMYWPVLLGATALAVVVPWFTGALDVDPRPALQILLTGGVISVLILQWTPASAGAASRSLPYCVSVTLIGAVWFAIGALEAPGLLVLFVLPVFASALASRGWLEYAVAALTVATVSIVAIVSDSGLRWYVGELDLLPRWLANALAGGSTEGMAVSATRFDGLAHVVALTVFGVTVFSVAFVGSMAARALSWMERRLESTKRSLDESEALLARLAAATPTLHLVVSPASGLIFANNSPGARDETLFDLLDPAFPEELSRLIQSESGGVLEARICRIDGEPRVVDIAADPVQLDGESLKRVTVSDTPEARLAARALDELDVGLLVIGPDHRLLFASRPFLQLFPAASAGSTAAAALDEIHGLPAGWWNVAPASQGRVKFTDGDKSYFIALRRTGESGADTLTLLHLTGSEST